MAGLPWATIRMVKWQNPGATSRGRGPAECKRTWRDTMLNRSDGRPWAAA
jgi:hypothetical protein